MPFNNVLRFTRRQWVMAAAASGAAPLMATFASAQQRSATFSVGALFAGQVKDGGFMEAGWRGLEKARLELGVQTRYVDGILPKKDTLAAALTQLATSGVDLVIAHGGQNNEACAEVAAQFPSIKFVVTQGSVSNSNLASYEVQQEDSAYLAGVLAALTTRTGVVGHMSGIRVRPGLKGRAAYAAGVRATNPQVKLLTNFSGNQDDNALSHRVATAQIAAGADVIFTMLNAGRKGAIEACRTHGARQIGNVGDWVASDPAVFIGSAIADVSIGVFEAVRDAQANVFPAGKIRKMGIANRQAVRLSMAADVNADVRARIDAAASDIASGRISLSEVFEGPEFPNPTT